jgi:penicillin-binding protein 2
MHKKQLESRQRFDSRMFLFYATLLLLLAVLLLHLLQLQWFEHERLALQADQNRLNVVPILPVRGEIVDANGQGLAINKIAYRVLLIPERVEQLEHTLQLLSEELDWSVNKLAHIQRRIKRSRPDRPVLLDDKLQWEQVSPIASRLHHLPGVDVEAGSYRYYPYAELTSHLIGYLSLARKKDVKAGYVSTEFIGRTGVERSFEKQLHGTLGSQLEEVDAHGRRIAVLSRTASLMGETLRLALDVDVQRAAADALGKRTGAVVVLDVRSGGVIALLSQPGYDTNRFITGLESEQWQSWLDDPEKPLLNRATQAAYPPASTFKLVTGLAGLQSGSHLAGGHTFCPGYLELADRKLRCWKRTGHGSVSLHKAIVQSCDVYFYKLGDQIGMAQLSATAQQWGLGEKTGIALSPESRGLIPAHRPYMMAAINNASKRRKRWFRGETMITAIGQGTLTTTPLQMARFAAAIANGGKVLVPQLLTDLAPEVVNKPEVKPEYLKLIQKAMRSVVENPHGTAHRVLSSLPWKVAGKTGTAQVVKMSQDDDGSASAKKELLRRYKDHAWFMGYAPYENPKIAIAVFVEHGGHGGSAAAPVAAAVIRSMAARQPKPVTVAR